MRTLAFIGALALSGLTWTGAAAQAPEEELPAGLREEIRKLGPSARIVGENDLDRQSCSPRPSPGLVVDDFNGNGRKDHAALVLTGASRKPPHPTPRSSGLEVEIVLLVMLDGDATSAQVVQRFWLPPASAARYAISVQPPASLVEFNGPGKVTLKQPGIMLVYCEAGMTVYYWSPRKRRFDSIVVRG
jgi:hypothetical protein